MQPNNPYGAPAPPPQPNDYSFITNSGTPQRRGPNLLPSNTSTPVRVAIVGGGLFVLLIVFLIVKGMLSGGGNTPALITVAQDQQEIIHIVTTATGGAGGSQTSLSTTNENFAVTANASLTSAQGLLLTYLADNGHKVNAKTVGLKLSASIDQQLQTASANSNYDETFQEIMQSQLTTYQQALQAAYRQTTGPKGRKLLSDEFNASKLLLQQLNTPSS
jgi:hypothetical protein